MEKVLFSSDNERVGIMLTLDTFGIGAVVDRGRFGYLLSINLLFLEIDIVLHEKYLQ